MKKKGKEKEEEDGGRGGLNRVDQGSQITPPLPLHQLSDSQLPVRGVSADFLLHDTLVGRDNMTNQNCDALKS